MFKKILEKILNLFSKFKAASARDKVIISLLGSVAVCFFIVIIVSISKRIVSSDSITNRVDVIIDSTPEPVVTRNVEVIPTPTPFVELKEGMEGEEIQILQERLMDLNYLDIDESTQYFGPATKGALEMFQRQEGFEQTGIADEQVINLIYTNDAKKYMIKEGFEGEDVRDLQYRLKELGYMKEITGYFGTVTTEAIKAFQKRNSLSSDGLAGEKTLDLIYSDKARPTADLENAKRRQGNIDKFISIARSKLGCKYVWGARGPKTFDCSGLVYYCLHQSGSSIGRYTAAGYSEVTRWSKVTSLSALKRGDLIFFHDKNSSRIGHVGIALGNGYMIDASSVNGKVVMRSCTTAWCKRSFAFGRRPW